MVPMPRRLLLLTYVVPLAFAGKKTPSAGSQKCPKGVFDSLVKDAAIPLCDAHYPSDNAKSGWAILFYDKDMEGVQEPLNRMAIDLGNEPPEKSKNLKKAPMKQKARIKNLAEKYEFEAKIPKKGGTGKEPLLKVGAVCCNCDDQVQKVCETKERGLRVVRPGKADNIMPGGLAAVAVPDTQEMMKFVMGALGYVKGSEESEPKEGKAEEAPVDIEAKIKELKARKAKAAEEEDFDLAGQLKKEIEELQKKAGSAKAGSAQQDVGALKAKLADLKAQKKKAAEEEDFLKAGKLKKEIDSIEASLAKQEL